MGAKTLDLDIIIIYCLRARKLWRWIWKTKLHTINSNLNLVALDQYNCNFFLYFWYSFKPREDAKTSFRKPSMTPWLHVDLITTNCSRETCLQLLWWSVPQTFLKTSYYSRIFITIVGVSFFVTQYSLNLTHIKNKNLRAHLIKYSIPLRIHFLLM